MLAKRGTFVLWLPRLLWEGGMAGFGRLAVVVAAFSLGWLPTDAFAQVPPHAPGTICFTRTFWCWAQPPGPPGYSCGCPTPYGIVPGVLG